MSHAISKYTLIAIAFAEQIMCANNCNNNPKQSNQTKGEWEEKIPNNVIFRFIFLARIETELCVCVCESVLRKQCIIYVTLKPSTRSHSI